MANKIKIKQSSVASKVPTTSDLEQGELAINTNDEKIYTKNSSGSIVELGATGTTYTSSDFDHDSLSGFVADEHIDWTADQGSTNIHSGNYTNTTYSVGDGGLTQKNFTSTLKDKLDNIATGATNVTNNNQLTNGAGYITGFTNTVDMGDGFKVSSSDGTDQFTVIENEEIRFAGSGATSVAFDATTQKVTISSTDNNTTYSVGDNGLTQKNFTSTLKDKLDGISSSADVNRSISDSVTSTSSAVSASSQAVKTAYDMGNHSHPYSSSSHNHDTAYLGKTAKATDSDKLDGLDSTKFTREIGAASATVGGGWITVAKSESGRHRGEVIVSDSDSGDHSYVRIEWMRSYADSNFTVITCGGHSNQITGARVLYKTNDNTYGWKLLQVYVTTSSIYRVQVLEPAALTGWSGHTVVTPVVQNTISGYGVHGNELTDLDSYSLASEEGILAGSNIKAIGTVTASGGNSGNWNTAYTHSQATHAPTNAQANRSISDSVTSTSSSTSASSQAVKTAYDMGNHSHPYSSSSHTHNYVPLAGGTMTGELQVNARLDVGDGSGNDHELRIYKKDNDVSDHLQFYNGTTRMGEIGCEDTTWLRINQETAKNIYTPRYMRADGGFFVDGTTKGINGSGNYIGGTITGASDANVSNWNTAHTHSQATHAPTNAQANRSISDSVTSTSSSVSASSQAVKSAYDMGNHSHPYAATSHTHSYDNYDGWDLYVDGVDKGRIMSGENVMFNAGDNIDLSYGWTNNVITISSSYTDTNTHRACHDTPVDGAWTTSISSNWAFDNVKTPVPSGALFTDTNTTYSAGRGLDLSGTQFQLETDLRDSITHIGYDSGDYVQFSNGSYIRHVISGTEYFRTDTGGIDVVGNITATGTITANSDERLKEDVKVIENPIEKIKAIRGVTYTRNDLEDKTTRHAGVIAQEVEAVLPEVVLENDEGIKSVAYGNMVSLLLEGMKEQQKQIDELKKKLGE